MERFCVGVGLVTDRLHSRGFRQLFHGNLPSVSIFQILLPREWSLVQWAGGGGWRTREPQGSGCRTPAFLGKLMLYPQTERILSGSAQWGEAAPWLLAGRGARAGDRMASSRIFPKMLSVGFSHSCSFQGICTSPLWGFRILWHFPTNALQQLLPNMVSSRKAATLILLLPQSLWFRFRLPPCFSKIFLLLTLQP